MKSYRAAALGSVIVASGIVATTYLGHARLVQTNPLMGKRTPRESFSNVVYVSNYDADTLLVNLPDLPPVFGYHIPVRVKHVDSPEMNSEDPCAKAVSIDGRDKVAALLKNAKNIQLVDVERDKYFRLLSTVVIDGSTQLHDFLLDNKLAVPYEGGTKVDTNWCHKVAK